MSDLDLRIVGMATAETTAKEIAKNLGCSPAHVMSVLKLKKIPYKHRKLPDRPEYTALDSKILTFAGQYIKSAEIAKICGCTARHVQNLLRYTGNTTLPRGAMPGKDNPSFVCGRRIHIDGYAYVSAPPDHPTANVVKGKNYKIAREHRLVYERHIGRNLLPTEIVDHIDGLTLHNDPLNLRLFACNADHLRATLTGQCPNWSKEGYQNILGPRRLPEGVQPVDTHRQRKARGDVRLIQILLAMLKLGKDSPFLLGTTHHLEKAQIDYSSQSKIRQALDDLRL